MHQKDAGQGSRRGPAEPGAGGTVSVLFVCMGNICRSPTAEGVVRHRAARLSLPRPLALDSAGTIGFHAGDPPDPRTVRAARRRGIELGDLRARQLTAADYTRHDLMLVMDERNLRDVLRAAPDGATARIGLFLEYAPGLGVREVPDPYYEGPEAFERVLDLAEVAGEGLLAALCAGRLAPP